ncbi:unnamed protein product [Chrysodeixis includens]|uniref:unspecific monooxygenase n=1 Tax=Chrysodeixis includens TaxID=689277 RepID=A0A9N8KWJ9_CHRIL|nr:unnamed protein product [Chrysodeixis includens]
MIVTITWLLVAVSLVVLYLRKVYSKLERDQVNHVPVIPFFGHIFWVFFKKEHVVDTFMKSIKAFPDDRVVGHYDMVTPSVIVKDVETIKKITIKDFEHFVDRRRFIGKDDPMFGRGLLMLTGDEWKAMRSTMSPAFTSSKIRLMVPFMLEVGERMIQVLRARVKDSDDGYVDLELKDLATRYANDVIASCAFGLKVDSQSEDNTFYSMSRNITTFGLSRIIKVFLFRAFPALCQLLNIKISPPEVSDFFRTIILGTMENRERDNIVRNDMINILMQVKKGQLTHEKEEKDVDAGFATVEESSIGKKQHNFEWSDNDLVAQAALFLFAGFDTVSTTMAFIVHELAINPECQERLAKEIKEHDAKNNGQIDYNSIQSMEYLDMIVSEGLRLWPAAGFMDRTCVKDYNLGRPNAKATKDLIVSDTPELMRVVDIRKGEYVVYPIWAFHRDPNLFPEPDKFIPERFSPQNKDKIKPFSYMPFGMGPRNCIGSRFALCEVKVMLYQLIRDMVVSPCERTCIPTRLSENGFNMMIRGGAWLRFRIRSN